METPILEQPVIKTVIPSSVEKKDNKIILRASNVDVFYGKFQAIHNISMEIEENSVTSFIGPSGCG